ncbi:hypothetical protein SAMN05216474_2304 [Lishizhenia tianjinensis]|uniref:Lipoprotein n=1 Tax=Lishizhenia tianjinensis TaxID=477690 RepID=A0A1I7AQA5_9FLAO|nr:hypothetical protein [Lishizhenia tianjinensis]SFT77053.1 hypothetical protein SAMN05216474_2304 [Lishizhenia tianjinensis]
MKKILLSFVVLVSITACKKEIPVPNTPPEPKEIEDRISYTKEGKDYSMNDGENNVNYTGGSGQVIIVTGGNQQDYHYFYENKGLVRNRNQSNEELLEIAFAYYAVDKGIYEADVVAATEEVAYVGAHPFQLNNNAGIVVNYSKDQKNYTTKNFSQETDAYVDITESFLKEQSEYHVKQKVKGNIPSCRLINEMDVNDTLILENISFELLYYFN